MKTLNPPPAPSASHPECHIIETYLVIRDGDRVVNQVADQAQLVVPEKLLGLDIELHSLGLLLVVSTSLDELSGVLLFLFSPMAM